MNKHETLNYLELPAKNLKETKAFFSTVFSWSFQAFGPDYSAFSDQTINGGFYKSNLYSSSGSGAALIVFYSEDLEATQKKIENANGVIIQEIFDFPGGRRFHFTEPSGNEFAVWSDRLPC